LRLGIEIDGGYHNEPAQAEYDEKRTKILEAEKILLIRIKNEEVLSNLEGVLHYIEEKVQARAIEL
jgi:very-short-patch-repair endonuclease